MEMKKRLQFPPAPMKNRVVPRGKASQTDQGTSKGSNRPNSAHSSHMITDSDSDSDTIDYEYNLPPPLEPDLASMGSPSGLEGQGNDSAFHMESISQVNPLVELRSSNKNKKVKHLLEAISSIL